MRHLRIEHTTRYEYTVAVTLQPHRLRLRPREGHDIRINVIDAEWLADLLRHGLLRPSFIPLRPIRERRGY